MYITWRKLNNRHYAYLVTSYWCKEKKAPRTATVYLGASLMTAQKNLERELAKLDKALPSRVKIDLLSKLGEKAPADVINLAPRDRAKEAVLRQLGKLREKYQNRQDLTLVLDRAIERLS